MRGLLICLFVMSCVSTKACPVDTYIVTLSDLDHFTLTHNKQQLILKTHDSRLALRSESSENLSHLTSVQHQGKQAQVHWHHNPDVDYHITKPTQDQKILKIQFYRKSCPLEKTYRVVIDPGHGGKDPGAVNAALGIYEKDVTLRLAKLVQERLKNNAHIQVIMTRQKDEFVSLRQRLDIAKAHQADLFISIHADAFIDSKAKGASVYTLSSSGAQSSGARYLSNQEKNMSMMNFDTVMSENRQLLGLLFDMQLQNNIARSIEMGDRLLKSISKKTPLHSEKVDHAAFMVLTNPLIPSLLIESGFLTNPVDAKRLTSQLYLNGMADQIALSVSHYFTPEAKHHIVKKGDTLLAIARTHHTSVSQLMKLNHLKSDQLRIGQDLMVSEK